MFAIALRYNRSLTVAIPHFDRCQPLCLTSNQFDDTDGPLSHCVINVCNVEPRSRT